MSKSEHTANPMWGGHFAEGPEEAFAAINPSIDFDKRLYAYDIAGSIAHCQMLAQQGIITDAESQQICDGLLTVKKEIEAGDFAFSSVLEDIHMNIESRLKELLGDVAGKLHTARSRNDQVCTDFRLYVRDVISELDLQLKSVQMALLAQAEKYADTVMPGFTHLQTAQPVTLGHHLMAYVEMFGRDRARLCDLQARANQSPLGAAALAGTGFPIDREATAKALGFDAPMRNSLDAVSARDFALELLSAASICAIHLSRLAEEFVLWTSAAFGFVKLPEGFTSGSSIMPQKRNPDAAELVRGKVGRIVGSLNSLLMTMKALPLAYNKDTQEDKEPVFDAADQLRLCIMAMIGMVEGFTANEEKMRAAAMAGFSTATDLADWLVRELGMPFRDAHHVTGRVVKLAEAKPCRLDELSLEAMQSVEPRITAAIFDVLSVEASVASRTSFGGTAPSQVRAQIAYWKEELN